MSALRLALFLTIALGIWAIMHLFVFWRLASVPWVAAHVSRRALILTAIALWASYPLARAFNAWKLEALGFPLEFFAANWIGVLFLLFSFLLVAEVLTFGGFWMSKWAPSVRGGAALIALFLSLVGLVQGLRLPVVREYEVHLADLPKDRDGLVLVAVSDLHLGALIGQRWMQRLIARINDQRPDMVAIVGDLVDGEVGRLQPLLPVLKSLRAPLGVWAVTGNHEYYAGLDRSVRLLEDAGYVVLRDRSIQVVPGLVLAGVDDLTAGREAGRSDRPVQKALDHRADGAVVFLSHSPLEAEIAASGGAGLMICGHTHQGQIWPFNYLVRLRYQQVAGRYDVHGMSMIVSRGAGTWGPRMRLWAPGEILRITLRTAPKTS